MWMRARLGPVEHVYCGGSLAVHPSFGRFVSKVSCGTDKQGHGDEVLSLFSPGGFSFFPPLVGLGGAQEEALLRVVVWCFFVLYFPCLLVVQS